MNTNETETQETTETTEATKSETLDLNINDLGTMKNIIDIASARGAFKPNEMVVVGQTYNKLVAFLEQVTKQQAAQQAASGENE